MTLFSMALKINVPQKQQLALNQALENAGYKIQRRKFHCTVGFIEKAIPLEETKSFGDHSTAALQEYIENENAFFEVDKAVHLFNHVIVFLPTSSSKENLMKINRWLFDKVQEISKNRWGLNHESLPGNYIPHLTLWHTRRLDLRFKKLEKFAETHPVYHLSEAAYVLFTRA
jgi:hypothetical protein